MNEKKQKKDSKVQIVNFNDMVNPKQETIKKLDPEESAEIRKKLMTLLFGLFVAGIALLALMTISNDSSSTKKTQQNNNVEEIEETLNDGIIDIEDNSISKYKDLLIINPYDTIFHKSLKKMFVETNANDLDNNNKLYLATKSTTFQNYIKNAGISYHQYQCTGSGTIEIDAQTMKNAMEEVFGSSVIYKNTDFYYLHYTGNSLINVYKLTFLNGKYTMTCQEKYSNDTNVLIQSKIQEIKHENDQLIFSRRVVFITKSGVYADPSGKILITKDQTVTFGSYIKKGTLYKFIFTKENGNYHLTNIQKQ